MANLIPVEARVKYVDRDFLSDGFVSRHINDTTGNFFAYEVTLDEKAPNEYAYETNIVMAFDGEIKQLKEAA